MFPEQLSGPNALEHLAGQEDLLRRQHRRHRRHDRLGRLHHRLHVPTATNNDTVAGVWTGYESPYLWPPGNVQGKPAGTPKIWAQVAVEGARRTRRRAA